MALVGVAQAARLVDDVAHGRPVADLDRAATLRGVFVLDPASVEAVFPEIERFRGGWETARALLARPDASVVAPLRYSLNLIELAERLAARPDVATRLRDALEGLAHDAAPWTRPDQLATVYEETISTLERRIQVTGDPELLQTATVAQRIRALLLAGIRYAWLWRQLGGRRWHLVLGRSSIRRDLDALGGLIS